MMHRWKRGQDSVSAGGVFEGAAQLLMTFDTDSPFCGVGLGRLEIETVRAAVQARRLLTRRTRDNGDDNG